MKQIKQLLPALGIIIGLITPFNLNGMEEKVETIIQLNHIKVNELPQLLTKQTEVTLLPIPASNSIKVIGTKTDIARVLNFITKYLDVPSEVMSPMLEMAELSSLHFFKDDFPISYKI
jgi:NADH/NAD ratio-sensing transcriptional regulator Rex